MSSGSAMFGGLVVWRCLGRSLAKAAGEGGARHVWRGRGCGSESSIGQAGGEAGSGHGVAAQMFPHAAIAHSVRGSVDRCRPPSHQAQLHGALR